MGIGYTNHLTDASSRVCISRLLDWKDNRGDEFDKPFTRTQGLLFNDIMSGHGSHTGDAGVYYIYIYIYIYVYI